jgi:hypothetical protein
MSGLPPVRVLPIDQIFINKCFKTIPKDKQSALLAQYSAIYPRSIREANLMLVDAVETQQTVIDRMQSVTFPVFA